MKDHRRIFLPAFVLTLSACLTAPAPAVDPKYLPGDTEIVITLNIKQLLASDVAKQNQKYIDLGRDLLEGQIRNNPAAKYLEKSGFNLFRDLQSITVASNGSKEDIVIFLEGKFDREKIQAVAEDLAKDSAEKFKIISIGATKVFEITPPGEKRGYAALVSDSLLIATTTQDALKNMLSGPGEKKLNDGLQSVLKTTSAAQSFSLSATGAGLAKIAEQLPIPNAEAAVGAFKAIDGLSAALTLNKDVQFQLGVNSKDEETAKKMAAGARGGILMISALAANKAKEQENLQPLVDVSKTLRVVTQGRNIVLRGEISIENLQKLIKALPGSFNP